MPTKLSRMKTREVSVVDRGANRKVWALLKNEDGNVNAEIIKACLETPIEKEAEFDATLQKAGATDKARTAMTAAMRVIHAFKDQIKPSEFNLMVEGLGYQVPDATAVAAAVAKAAAAKPAPGADCPTCGQTATQKDAGTESVIKEDVMKELPAEVRAQLEKSDKAQKEMNERLEKSEKALAVEMEKRHTRECVAKAAKEFAHLGPAEEVGEVLKSLEGNPGLEKLLRAANERAKAAALFEERGRTVSKSSGDAFKQITASAAELRKADSKLTPAQAFDNALRLNPEVYARYLDEQKENA